MSHTDIDVYDCIGGEGWYQERCSENFLVAVPLRMFSDIPPLAAPFRDDISIRLGNDQQLRLPESDRKEYYENIRNFTLRASSGIVNQRHDSKYELSTFQELSMLVHVSTSYEEAFIRRNAVLKFQQRILRSAQNHHASLKPAYPGSPTFCTCGNAIHLEYCPMHDLYDDEKDFLYPLLEPGDRVKAGPDWQWGDQGGGGEGTVIRRKEWKGVKDKGISVQWDNGDANVYRYGADCCYDVVESNPMQKTTYVPVLGVIHCAETYWSRYVPHYIHPEGIVSLQLQYIVPYERIISLLPDFDMTSGVDETLIGSSLHTIECLFQRLEKEYMSYLNSFKTTHCFQPSALYEFIIQKILYPFQIYLLSQAEGDTSCQRSESVILEGYVMFVVSSSIRIIHKTIECVIANPDSQSVLVTSLSQSVIGHLLSYLFSMLYLGQYSHHVALTLRRDLNDLTMEWCRLLKVCHIDKALKQTKEDLLTVSVYAENYKTVPISSPWYLTVLYLMVTTNTKYHYSCLYFNYVEPREDICCLLESYIFSGGLADSPETSRETSLLRSLYENEMSEYDFVHTWLDSHFPEPAWKRKRQPIHVNFELKMFVVLVHLCNYSSLLYDTYNHLMETNEMNKPIPAPFRTIWRQVIAFREHLRKKKQEYASHSGIGFNHAHSQMIVPMRHISSSQIMRSDSSQFRSEQNPIFELNIQSIPSERRGRLRKMISEVDFSKSAEIVDQEPVNFIFKRMPTPTNNMTDIHQLAGDEETELMFTSHYEEYVDLILQKFDLLMMLNKPWNLNENEDMDTCIMSIGEGQKQILASLKKTSSLIIEEKGVIPQSIDELIFVCVSKFLYGNTTVTCKHLMNSLRHRTDNARNKKRIFDEAVEFLKQISVFPEAARLFLLGLFHETTVFSNLCVGGYHNNKRRRDGVYGIDYLENCEGASHPVMLELVSSLMTFCEYLKSEFLTCVSTLQWRYGSAIVWFLTTITSPKLPYFPLQLGLLDLFEECSWKLGKWYEMTNDYSKDILISPGAFWDSLSQKPISFASSHFHKMLTDIRENGSYVNIHTIHIPGIFPASIMVLANSIRLAYTITIIQQVSDYVSRSRASPAQNRDTLYNWTLTDVSNLFVRQSIPYLTRTYLLFNSFIQYFDRMKNVLKERCDSWQPFAPISYNNNESGGNPYCCVKQYDEKNIMRGMIATDMLISAAEATIASYLALLVFIVKTRSSFVLPWKQYGNVIWDLLYFSPRHQKLATMLLQSIIPSTDYIPPVFEDVPRTFAEVTEGTPDTDSIIKNPFLRMPVFPQDMKTTTEKREAFIYYLLHLASHSDGCPGALVGERTSCTLCCDFFPFIYNTMCPSSSCYSLPNKGAFIEEILITRHKIFVSSCKMHIRPEGHNASFCSLVFAEEVVYLLRRMINDSKWRDVMMDVFQHILSSTASWVTQENNQQSTTNGFHPVLRKRTTWFCMATAVLKVLGAITPRMYAGCRIRIAEFLMEGENDVSNLIHTAYQSHGTGSIIKYHRSMGEALVLMDKIDTPVYVNNYVFDVVDRIEPPRDSNGRYSIFLQSIIQILTNLKLHEDIFTLPAQEMAFFNTSDLPLSPAELQDVILYLYCTRCINHMIIANDSLAKELSPTIIQQLITMAIRPLPCNVSFNTLIIRQYFNLFIEYLIDTYVGAARLLPMDLQTEEDGEVVRPREKVDLAFGLGKEEEEVFCFDQGENQNQGPKVIRNEKRMRMAEGLSVITNIDTLYTYAVLQAFNDRESDAYNFLMGLTPESRYHLCSPIQIERHVNSNADESILNDMELGIRQLHIASSLNENTVSEETLSRSIPPFTSLQKLTLDNMNNSIYGVVASVTDKTVLYSPIPQTGVITAVKPKGVMLSMLNVNSGILEECTFPAEQISLHRHRLLYYLGNVKLLRGVAGRICGTLVIKYIRELIICLLYYLSKNHIDVLEYWKVEPDNLVLLTKFTYVSYMNNMILNPSKQNHVTLVACLFRILKGCIKNMIISLPKGNLLLDALLNGVWDEQKSYQNILDKYKRASIQNLSHAHMGSVSSIHVGHAFNNAYTVTSLHPTFSRSKVYEKIVIEGVEGLRVVFDKRCCLDPAHASLTFFKDENHSQIIARFTGDSSNFCAFTVRGNTLRYLFESSMHARPTWGFAFLIQPFEHVRWNGDLDVLEGSCFDWNCFVLNFVMDVSCACHTVNTQYFTRAMHNMIGYLRSSGMPFKSRVVELLIKMQSFGSTLLQDRPDLSGMYDVVIQFSEGLDSQSIVPSQLPLLIEFLASYSNSDTIHSLKDAKTQEQPFNPHVEDLGDSLRDQIDSIYILTHCLYNFSNPPQVYLKRILQMCCKEWNEQEYKQLIQCYKRFSRKVDLQLIGSFDQKCVTDYSVMLDYDLMQFTLDEDDKARYYALSSFSNTEVRLRLALIQFYNQQLLQIIHLIDFGSSKENDYNTLGKYISLITGYVFLPVKETFLQLSINQTIYHGKDCYPVITLDNRRVFTDMEKSSSFEEERNALTSQCTFAQLYRQMKVHNTDCLRAQLDSKDRLMAIKYKGEQGLDWGGLYHDTIERCVEDLFSDHIDLFILCPNSRNEEGRDEKFIPNPKYRESNDILGMYTFVGNLIGISLRTKQLMSIELCSAIWKTIVGDTITVEDLEAVDSEFVNALNQVKEYKESDGKEDFAYLFGLTFSVSDSAGSDVELIPSGSQVTVTFENRMHYYDLALDYRLNEWKQAAEAIASGVYALIPQRALSLFTWEQLERAVKGVPDISVDVLKIHTIYEGWSENHPVIQRFWRVFRGFSNKDRSQFLRFAWGRSRLPKSNPWPRSFKIKYNEAGDEMLPTAHTCFFQLDLPQYSTDAIMRERLLVAIHFGAGEFMLR